MIRKKDYISNALGASLFHIPFEIKESMDHVCFLRMISHFLPSIIHRAQREIIYNQR